MLKLSLLLLLFSASACSLIAVKDRSEKAPIKKKSELFSARKGQEMKKRVVVLPVLNLSSYPSEEVNQAARELYIKHIEKVEDIILVEPRSVGLQQWEDLKNGESYKLEEISRRVRATGIHALLVPTIKDLRTGKSGDSVGLFRRVKAKMKAQVEVDVVSVRSGKSMAIDAREADSTETFTRVASRSFTDRDLADDPETVKLVVDAAFEKTLPLVVDTLRKFSWEGRVALVKGEKVYLNAGRLSGLQVGDVLRILEGMDEVFDPETSQSLGTIKGRMKGTVEVISYFGNDGAVTVIHSGSGFKENDLVEFY